MWGEVSFYRADCAPHLGASKPCSPTYNCKAGGLRGMRSVTPSVTINTHRGVKTVVPLVMRSASIITAFLTLSHLQMQEDNDEPGHFQAHTKVSEFKLKKTLPPCAPFQTCYKYHCLSHSFQFAIVLVFSLKTCCGLYNIDA